MPTDTEQIKALTDQVLVLSNVVARLEARVRNLETLTIREAVAALVQPHG